MRKRAVLEQPTSPTPPRSVTLRARQFALVICVCLAALGAQAHVARAETAAPTAKQLYDEGRKSYNLGRYDEALGNFERAYKVKDDPAFLFNIAQCQRALHRYDDAQRSYRAYLRENTSIGDNTRHQVQQLIAEMDKAIADERAKQAPTGSEAPAPAPISAPAARAKEPAAPASNLVASAPAPSDKKPLRKRWWLWTAVGVAAAAGVGIGLGLGLTPNDASIPHTTGGNVPATLH